MLPSFPKSQKILDDEWHKRMFAAKAEVFPHAVHPPVRQIIEGKRSDYQREDRKVKSLEMKRFRAETSHDIKEGKGMTLTMFDAKAKELGQEFGKNMWKVLIGGIEEAVAETGNELKYKKGNLKQEDILRMVEMMQLDFDEHGKPTQMLILPPEMADEFKKREAEWADDRKYHTKLESIKRRKKEDFDAREARRRLV